MRVIAGVHKGRRLRPPTGLYVRPTSERVREALFSILGAYVEQAHVVDLYSGTGAIGLEALSRGAAHVVFVEHQPSSLQLLRENLKRCGNPAECTVIASEVRRAFQNSDLLTWAPFHIVFADPPYYTPEEIEPLLSILSNQVLLAESGLVILEHPTRITIPQQIENIRQFRQARYGDTSLTFFKIGSDSNPHANRHLSRNV